MTKFHIIGISLFFLIFYTACNEESSEKIVSPQINEGFGSLKFVIKYDTANFDSFLVGVKVLLFESELTRTEHFSVLDSGVSDLNGIIEFNRVNTGMVFIEASYLQNKVLQTQENITANGKSVVELYF